MLQVLNYVMRHRKAESPVELLKILMSDFQNDFISKLVKLCNFGPPPPILGKYLKMHKKCQKLVYSAAEKTVRTLCNH